MDVSGLDAESRERISLKVRMVCTERLLYSEGVHRVKAEVRNLMRSMRALVDEVDQEETR